MDTKNVYPLELILRHSIGKKGHVTSAFHNSEILISEGAIKLVISVDSPNYPKSAVREAIKEICLKAVQYYD